MPSSLHEVARAALSEITPDSTIGELSGESTLDGATTVTFATLLPGYPGWNWTVSIATLGEPSVLEVELMPGDGALLAPDWVPWIDRLADYEAAQELLAASDGDGDEVELSDTDVTADDAGDADDVEEDDLDDDDDDDDLDDALLHSGDLDGVDIDDLDESVD
jgi:Protein of unknown function (DUF3027)